MLSRKCYNTFMKSHIILIRDLPSQRVIEKRFFAKPYWTLYLVFALSIAFFFALPTWGLMGLVVGLYCLISLFQFPDIPLVEISKDSLILYKNSEEAYLLYWEDLYQWSYQRKREYDKVQLVMVDGSIQSFPFYSKKMIQVYMDKYAPKKEG